MGPRHKKVQAGTECWNHPAPCLRREDLHTQRLTPHIATLIILFCLWEYKAVLDDFGDCTSSVALCMGLFPVRGAFLLPRGKGMAEAPPGAFARNRRGKQNR